MGQQQKALITVREMGRRYHMSFGVVEALRTVSFNIASGESVAIMGPSGSGKSTLMHLLGALDRPTSGNYFLNDVDVGALADKELAALRAFSIGFVFQAFNLIPQLTVYENVELPFHYRGSALKDARQQILDAIDIVGLSHRCDHYPNQLSGGEMQRAAIARAVALQPLLILADEPTGNLDSATGKKILDLFAELNSRGVTLLIVTHDDHVGSCCRRKIAMRDGLIISDETQE